MLGSVESGEAKSGLVTTIEVAHISSVVLDDGDVQVGIGNTATGRGTATGRDTSTGRDTATGRDVLTGTLKKFCTEVCL